MWVVHVLFETDQVTKGVDFCHECSSVSLPDFQDFDRFNYTSSTLNHSFPPHLSFTT